MELSVVVPTLNGREQLKRSLDAINDHVPAAETIVVNGPSSDGTTGMIREREDVDVLLELSDRNVNVARNAGIGVATGDAVGLISYRLAVEPSWYEAAADALVDGADAVTGPTHRTLRAGMTTESEETRTYAGRSVSFCNGDNVVFDRDAIEAIDGFDEYLETGGARDVSHRLAAVDRSVTWAPEMSVRGEYGADGGRTQYDWGWRHQSVAYQLCKNYGVHHSTIRRMTGLALRDAAGVAKDVFRGDVELSAWLGNGRTVMGGVLRGCKDGFAARSRDGTAAKNPNGLADRHDRVVELYDWR
ncbi:MULTISPECIES: glycosyltransferase family 2 protein [Halostella]|uniref:glycosyltransferase family 2 protein n=1 Tax=Halostella TaxID=1843185 RepID=UPI0010814F32|nr:MULTISPECIES: glycosyltransferase [Halostella]